MLVLTRQEGESLTIGDGIVVTVLKLRTRDVSIGIQAPREVPVVRTELLDRAPLLDPTA